MYMFHVFIVSQVSGILPIVEFALTVIAFLDVFINNVTMYYSPL